MGSGSWNKAHSNHPPTRNDWLYRLLNWLFTREDIDSGGRCEYLHRWWIRRSRGWGCYLHHFVGNDGSRDLHDHPRRFISIGLWGSYEEITPLRNNDGTVNWDVEDMTRYQAPWIRSFPATHIHRVVLDPGCTCWTLLIVMPVSREWGFWPKGRWVLWRDYLTSSRADEMKDC